MKVEIREYEARVLKDLLERTIKNERENVFVEDYENWLVKIKTIIQRCEKVKEIKNEINKKMEELDRLERALTEYEGIEENEIDIEDIEIDNSPF